jgi:two-component system response regulator VicR
MILLIKSIPFASGMEIMKEKILVIDNDSIISEMIKVVLENDGFEVRGTSNSHDAIDVAKQWKPNLILLDLRMPEINGFTIIERIREFASTPIILLSGTEENTDLVRGFDAGANDFILKPFSSYELIDRVEAFSQRFDTGNVRRNEPNGRD